MASGQIVIITARWVLVLAGLLLTLWQPGTVAELRVHIVALLLLAVGNFYLHAQVLMRRPLAELTVYAASVADIVVITLLAFSQGGAASGIYIFYFPAIMAFSVAFPGVVTGGFVAAVLLLYGTLYGASMVGSQSPETGIARLLMIAAVATCGYLYWRIEAGRRKGIAATLDTLLAPDASRARAAAEDLFFGQIVTIWARWFVIAASGAVALWSAATPGEVTVATLVVVALMALNFFLHGRYLMERPANRALLLAVSVLDVLLISVIVATWQGGVGVQSQLFVLYYPVLLAFAFVFPPRVTLIATVATLAAYVGACLAADPGFVLNMGDVKTLVMRLITLGAMGGLGTFYWRIQRQRRRDALKAVQPTA
ncbi:MAG: hypothetical protein H7Y32_14810 [Chloroflexales bacterium]|nr:hypothetical protein [Chloroflexales bacterium]